MQAEKVLPAVVVVLSNCCCLIDQCSLTFGLETHSNVRGFSLSLLAQFGERTSELGKRTMFSTILFSSFK